MRSDSAEFIRELVLSGVGMGLLSTWDVGVALQDGRLRIVLPDFRGTGNSAIHAVYPSRDFVPAKVDVLIAYLAEIYGPVPYWENGLDLNKLSRTQAPRPVSRRVDKGQGAAMATR
jgi:DNA-binding transcriptional LysR family regulator